MTKMTYEEVLNWIHGQLKFGIKPGVKRMEWMLSQLGNPEKAIKGIHVVGTNGKGSTVNDLQHMFSDAGYEVGTFISPYIMDFRERIAINGQMISKTDLINLAEIVKPVADRMPVETDLKTATEFELITTMMFVYFGQIHPVDIAVIEAGLGGLYDSTNVFQALAVVCPSIGLDHQTYLGETHAAIAENKSGVLKGGEPFIYATQYPEVQTVFENRARELGCQTYQLGRDMTFEENGRAMTYRDARVSIDGLIPAMPGHHQMANASLAICTGLLLQDAFPKLTVASIKHGIEKAKWQGRTEFMAPNLMIDGAHNDDSVAALVALLNERYQDRHIHVLFAAIDTKPMTTMLSQLSSFDTVEVTTFDYPNALSLEAYPPSYDKVVSYQEWVDRALSDCSGDLFIVTGSLYFISQVRTYLLRKSSESIENLK